MLERISAPERCLTEQHHGACVFVTCGDFADRCERRHVHGPFVKVGEAAGGFLGLVEAMRQLTGKPLGAPVANATVGVVSGFGMINYDRGLSSAAAILARAP